MWLLLLLLIFVHAFFAMDNKGKEPEKSECNTSSLVYSPRTTRKIIERVKNKKKQKIAGPNLTIEQKAQLRKLLEE